MSNISKKIRTIELEDKEKEPFAYILAPVIYWPAVSLSMNSIVKKSVVVFQNCEVVYWQLLLLSSIESKTARRRFCFVWRWIAEDIWTLNSHCKSKQKANWNVLFTGAVIELHLWLLQPSILFYREPGLDLKFVLGQFAETAYLQLPAGKSWGSVLLFLCWYLHST